LGVGVAEALDAANPRVSREVLSLAGLCNQLTSWAGNWRYCRDLS
jgi:hypothetical protein